MSPLLYTTLSLKCNGGVYLNMHVVSTIHPQYKAFYMQGWQFLCNDCECCGFLEEQKHGWSCITGNLQLSWEASIAQNRLHRRKSKTYLVNWQSKLLFIPSDTGQVCTASDKNKTWAVARLLVLFVHTWWYQLSKSTMGRCSSWLKTASSWIT